MTNPIDWMIIICIAFSFLPCVMAVFLACRKYCLPKGNKGVNVIIFWLCYLVVCVSAAHLNHYLFSSVAGQITFILAVYLLFQGNQWTRLGIASVLAAVLEFSVEIQESVLGILRLLLIGRKQPELFVYIDSMITCAAYLLTAVSIYIIFYYIGRQEIFFSEKCGKLVFFPNCLLLVLMDLVNFGITHGISMVTRSGGINFYGDSYGNPFYNELLTQLEIIVLAGLSMGISMLLFLGVGRLAQYTAWNQIQKSELIYYKSLQEQYQSLNRLQHDWKNHMISMNSLAEQREWDKLKQYLSHMSKEGQLTQGEIETGNLTVNGIVAIKKKLAEREGIRFVCDLHIPHQSMLSDFDWCILLGNTLDNAIEACCAMKEMESHRFISVQGTIVKKYFVLEVRNSVDCMDVTENQTIQQGIGLQNVQRIVDAYDGILNISIKNGFFIFSALLPVK